MNRDQAAEIGFWMSRLEDDNLCLPQELPKIHPEEKEAVLKFLSAGTIFETYRGYDWCRFLCGVPNEPMGHHDLINGSWIYPEGLIHYVDIHNVSVPPQLVAAAFGRCTEPLRTNLWKDFCALHMNPALRTFLRSLRVQLESDLLTAIEESSDQLEISRGLAESNCVWAKCTRRALKGLVLCSRHWSPDNHTLIRSEYSSRAFSQFLRYANTI